MQRKRRMLTASRLCLLGIAVSASSFSVFAQCPNDINCEARVGRITAAASGQIAVFGTTDGNYGVYGSGAVAGVRGDGGSIGVQGLSYTGNGVYPINEPQ